MAANQYPSADGASGSARGWGSNDVLNQMNVTAATRATLVPDIQGSVIASLDSSSGTLSKIGYLPYGKSASATAPFGYTGQRIDPETNGLYYYRARHYSPTLGRFMQPDPLGTVTDNLQASVTGTGNRTNLYVYVNNDPLNNVDPSGLWGFLLSFGGQAEAGLLPFGQAGGQASRNIAFLADFSQWSLSNPFAVNFSLVSYQSYGGTAALGMPSSPAGLNLSNNPVAAIANNGGGVIVGAYAGGGLSAGITNANTAADFAPPSATASANIGLFGTAFSGQFSKTATGIWTATANVPGLGYGVGAGASIYQTQSNVLK